MPERLFDYEHWGTGIFPGEINMALEEFMVKRIAGQNGSKPFAALRFYSFPDPTIVVGYGQSTDIIKDPRVAVTRRITGGSHVQTGRNILAYSFVVPRDGSFRTYEDMRTYFAGCVANGLTDIGIEDVTIDNKASTINVKERIIASHAIFWGIKSALLHGLIHLTPYDVDRIASRVFLQTRRIGNHIYSEEAALRNLPTISTELNGGAPNHTKIHILRNIVSGTITQQVTGHEYERRQIDEKVLEGANELYRQKYGNPLWINKHRPTFTIKEVESIPGEELDGPLKEKQGYCLFLQVPDKDFRRMAESVE